MNATAQHQNKTDPKKRWENEGGATPPRPSAGADQRTDHVRARAYEIFMFRCSNGIPGDECSDWYQAEHELHNGATGGRPTATPVGETASPASPPGAQAVTPAGGRAR